MEDDDARPERGNPEQWLLDQELEVAAEVYAAEMGLRVRASELSDEELLERYLRETGFALHFDIEPPPAAPETQP